MMKCPFVLREFTLNHEQMNEGPNLSDYQNQLTSRGYKVIKIWTEASLCLGSLHPSFIQLLPDDKILKIQDSSWLRNGQITPDMTSRPINNQEYLQDCREVSSGYGYGSEKVGVIVTITWSVAPNVGHCSGHGMFRVPSPEASQEVRWGAQADLRQEEAHAVLQGDHQAHLQAGNHVTWYQGVNWGKF